MTTDTDLLFESVVDELNKRGHKAAYEFSRDFGCWMIRFADSPYMFDTVILLNDIDIADADCDPVYDIADYVEMNAF